MFSTRGAPPSFGNAPAYRKPSPAGTVPQAETVTAPYERKSVGRASYAKPVDTTPHKAAASFFPAVAAPPMQSGSGDASGAHKLMEMSGSQNPRDHLRGTLLYLLAAAGLTETTKSLQSEAGLHGGAHPEIQDLLAMPVEDRMRALGPLIGSTMEKRHHAVQAQHQQDVVKFKAVAEKLDMKQRKIEEFHEKVKQLRSTLALQNRALQVERQAKLARHSELQALVAERTREAAELKLQISTQEATVQSQSKELTELEDEIKKLREQAPPPAPEPPRRVLNLFDLFDKDGSGTITAEEFEEGLALVDDEVRRLRELLANWDAEGGARSTCEDLFRRADADGNGKLQWNNNELRTYARTVFTTLSICIPPWQDPVWYDLYRHVDADLTLSLDIREAVCYAKVCLEETLRALLKLPALAKAMGLKVRMAAEPPPPVQTTVFTYTGGVRVDLREFLQILHATRLANQPHRARLLQLLETGEVRQLSLNLFRQCDQDRSGALTWNNGEIRTFIQTAFRQLGLIPPLEEPTYKMYRLFDTDKTYSLDEAECIDLIDALVRAVFIEDTGATSGGGSHVFAPGSGAGSTSRSSTPMMQRHRATTPVGVLITASASTLSVGSRSSSVIRGSLAPTEPVMSMQSMSRVGSKVTGVVSEPVATTRPGSRAVTPFTTTRSVGHRL
eukprot:TRINITY_DN40837_c0_g1_i1.p1 TRINITY_DN40837_c0_g1~~TRINITY_DN40837_c0_g1_i1.p1  ORF type:complete len:673 (+),score=149.11 TRINITY_DN40837_c0_g1_i1:100-2118(+)